MDQWTLSVIIVKWGWSETTWFMLGLQLGFLLVGLLLRPQVNVIASWVMIEQAVTDNGDFSEAKVEPAHIGLVIVMYYTRSLSSF